MDNLNYKCTNNNFKQAKYNLNNRYEFLYT